MFRIDKKLVSYSSSSGAAARAVYTNVGDSSGEKKREEEAKKLEEAREEARRMIGKAKEAAGSILSDAKAEAESILSEAKVKTGSLLSEAEAEAGRILSEAKADSGNLLSETEKAAASLLSEAEAQARKLTEAAGAEAEAVLAKAKQDGYEEGTRRAERELDEHKRRETAQIGALLEKIGRERDAAVDIVEEDIIGLVLEISKKVINVRLEKDDKTVVEIVRNALGKMKRQGRIEIRVGPEDYRRIFSSGIAEFVVGDETVRAAVTEEPHFGRGDCVLESDGETINAGVDMQLRSIALAFRSRAKDGDEDNEL